MGFVGSGIRHKATDYLQQRTPIHIPEEVPNLQDEDIQHNMQDHTQEEEDHSNNEEDQEDLEEVDTNKEVNYGYADNCRSEGQDSKSKDSEESNDSDDKDE